MSLRLRFAYLFTITIAILLLVSSFTIFYLYAEHRKNEYINKLKTEAVLTFDEFRDKLLKNAPIDESISYECGDNTLIDKEVLIFNANNQFIIENILRVNSVDYDWYDLIDKMSWELSWPIKNTITVNSNTEIACLFQKLVYQRNRIIHSFQITYEDEQILRTKNKKNEQYNITEEYLLEFIKGNEVLSTLLHSFRGY